MIDIIMDREVQLTDPIFGQAAVIAATVHLYYSCAADTRLKQKSIADLAKCRRFINSFTSFSTICVALICSFLFIGARLIPLQEEKLDTVMELATGSEQMNLQNWSPAKIYLNSRYMWDLIHTACSNTMDDSSVIGVLHPNLAPKLRDTIKEELVFEIICSGTPDIDVNTSDGGQTAPMMSISMAPPGDPEMVTSKDIPLLPQEVPRPNISWLWTDYSNSIELGDRPSDDLPSTGIENSAWWDFGNL